MFSRATRKVRISVSSLLRAVAPALRGLGGVAVTPKSTRQPSLLDPPRRGLRSGGGILDFPAVQLSGFWLADPGISFVEGFLIGGVISNADDLDFIV